MNAKRTARKLKVIATCAALTLCGFGAQAAPVYNVVEAVLPGGLATLQAERAAWATAHGGGLSTEGFEGLAAAPASPFDFGAFTLTSSVGLTLFGANALTRTEGVKGLGFSGNGTVTFTFDSAITAFGIDWSSFDQGSTVVAYSDDAGGAVADIFVPVTPAGGGFFGVRNTDGFTSVSFQVTQAEILEFDYIQWGTAAAVPEPMSLLLVVAGLAAVGVSRSRRPS
jgi:hypothetical protein